MAVGGGTGYSPRAYAWAALGLIPAAISRPHLPEQSELGSWRHEIGRGSFAPVAVWYCVALQR